MEIFNRRAFKITQQEYETVVSLRGKLELAVLDEYTLDNSDLWDCLAIISKVYYETTKVKSNNSTAQGISDNKVQDCF